MFYAIGPNQATSSPTMGVTGKRTKPQNPKHMTRFCRTVPTSSSEIRIKRCRSYQKEDSKSYTLRMKIQIQEHVLFFNKQHPCQSLNMAFLQSPQGKIQAMGSETSPGPEGYKKQRSIQSIVFLEIRTNLAKYSPIVSILGKRTKPQNLEHMTVFYRTVLTSSSGLRIKRCQSCCKEDPKSYTLGRKLKYRDMH